MNPLSLRQRVAYFVLGLPGLYLSLFAPVSIYTGLWAFLSGSDMQILSLAWLVLMPLLGAAAAVSGLLLILRAWPASRAGRAVHVVLLSLGVMVAALLAWPAGDILFRFVVLSPAVAGGLLIYHLISAAQQGVPGATPPLRGGAA